MKFSLAHDLLLAHYDIDRWHWNSATPAFDVCLGCILVQHTAWTNVERVLVRLREAGIDSIEALCAVDGETLIALIRPSGTPVIKARRLQAFCDLVTAHGGLDALFARPAGELRSLLLATYGIGPETADAICLYGAKQPVVVNDAYTERLCRRLGTGPNGNSYESWRAWLDVTLPANLDYRWRNHAAIVVHCKELCRVKPKCSQCPLTGICEYYAKTQAG
jgi:endonuclease-3 related protein